MAQRTRSQAIQNEVSDSADSNWLTAKEVMEATGITKDDLIQFIQRNILPKSMMRVLTAESDSNQKRSYFSPTLLGHVAMLKLLRDEGHSIETIANELGSNKISKAPIPQQPLSDESSIRPASNLKAQNGPVSSYPLKASVIAGSAFFINQDLCLEWVKVDADDVLFKIIRDEMQDDPSGSVFDILLRASLKELVFSWQPLFSFIYRFLEETTPPGTFKRVAPLISSQIEEIHRTEASFARITDIQPRIDSCPIYMEDKKGRMRFMRLYAMPLSEGALFIFQEDRWASQNGRWHTRGANGHDAAANEKTVFSVISAKIDNAQRLVDTLLPEAYFQLVSRIWDETDRIVQAYGGQRSRRNGTEVQYVIPQHAGTDPAFDAIRCSIEMRKKAGELEDSFKKKGRWFADIRLNIGISSGKDSLRGEDITASMAFMLPGGAADQAFHLSNIARNGGILITKTAFSHLSRRQRSGITFGIYRDNHLISNIFNQVSEFPQPLETPPMPKDIGALFTTCIVDLRH